MESMMTARQVAELLGVHENWVYDQSASGELPSYKIGGTRRFDRGELRDWIAEHREPERRHRAARRAAPAAAQSGDGHTETRSLETARSKRSTVRKSMPASGEDGEAQPTLFETSTMGEAHE